MLYNPIILFDRALFRYIKCIQGQQMHINFIDVLLLYCSHQHVSTIHVAIFRVISLRTRIQL